MVIFFFGQVTVSGKITDEETLKPLPFVAISITGTQLYSLSDLDGQFNFKIPLEHEKQTAVFHYTGYETKKIRITELLSQQNKSITLRPSAIQLQEITVNQKQNPAHRIVLNVTRNRKQNNPEKSVSFSYTSYNKMYITADFDSKNDSVESENNKDTTMGKVKQVLEKQHLFMTESISERKYLFPERNRERILASKVSGFKNSPFTLLATQMQSFSFYDDLVVVFDKRYLNPISEGSIKKYFFQIRDTLWNGKDTVYTIFFRPMKNKNFDGLKGTLYISTDGWAIQNVLAEPSEPQGTLSIKIEQQYEKINGQQWFPVALHTDWIYLNSNLQDSSVSITKKANTNSGKLKAVARTNITDIKINPEIQKSEFSEVEISLNNDADKKDEDFWNRYRTEALNRKEKRTYQKIDSIGKSENFDKKLIWIEMLATGKWNYKKFDLDLNRILKYNEYEGTRLGLGLHTSSKLSNIVNLGGYFAYGFSDRQLKFGGDLNFNLWKNREWNLQLKYENDVIESGGQSFFENKKILGFAENIYDVYIKKMDRCKTYSFRTDFRIMKYFRLNTFIQHQERISPTGFFLKNEEGLGKTIDTFRINEAGVQIKFIYREKFLKTIRSKISLGSDYPQVLLNFSTGIKQDLFDLKGKLDFKKIDLRIEQAIRFKHYGALNYCLLVGKVVGDLPYSYLYNMRASRTNNVTISTPNSFETMNRNEFVASSFLSLFLNYNLGKFLRKRDKFNPELEFVHNMGMGMLEHPNSHANIGIKVPEKGYFESGIRIHQLVKSNLTGLGLGLFYRYGPYKLPSTKENLYVRITLGMSI